MSNWIRINRNILDWEWYGDSRMVHLFIHLIAKANWKEGNWRGRTIERGKFPTGLDSLSCDIGVPKSTVNRMLKKLENSGEITQKTENKFRIVTVCNYDRYQSKNDDDGKQMENKRKTDGKQMEPIEEGKEGEEGEEGKKTTITFGSFNFSAEEIKEINRIRKANKGPSITQRVANTLAKQFTLAIDAGMTFDEVLDEWEERVWKSFKYEWTARAKGLQAKTGAGQTDKDQFGRKIL